MPESQKTAFLLRLVEGDPHVADELRGQVQRVLSAEVQRESPLRSVASLWSRAEEICKDREAAAAERRRAEHLRQEQLEERARQVRLSALRRRGADVWREVETDVERRNASGYDRATSLIVDLRAVAQEDDAMAEFASRLDALRKRHARKQRFIERLRRVT